MADGRGGSAERTRDKAMAMATVDEAIEDYRSGRFVIIVDDEGRENEGDLTLPAQFVTPEGSSSLPRHTSGIICVPITGERLDQLRIPLMVGDNKARFGTAFTVSVDARPDISTGVSAHDRAQAVKKLVDPDSGPDDLVMPGHA